MVSIATAVFPVCRSPMINSRWPRPMGIMLSIAFIPVCSGSFTGWRAITPNAFRSMGREWDVSIGPFPSIGCPRGLTTRPNIASPTGVSTTRPVLFARSPSFTSRVSPNNTRPTLSSSRFNAIPKTPFGSSTSSELITFSRPDARATPSPTSITSPTSATSTEPSNFSICSRSNWVN